MIELPPILLALAFVSVGIAAWILGRRNGAARTVRLPRDYYVGLDHLIERHSPGHRHLQALLEFPLVSHSDVEPQDHRHADADMAAPQRIQLGKGLLGEGQPLGAESRCRRK